MIETKAEYCILSTQWLFAELGFVIQKTFYPVSTSQVDIRTYGITDDPFIIRSERVFIEVIKPVTVRSTLTSELLGKGYGKQKDSKPSKSD